MQHSKSYNRDKSPLYENEIPCQMVSSIAQKYLGNYYEDKFFEYGLIIIKPEALIMGKVDEIFSIFCTRGYELVYFTRKKIDAMCTAEMWKFSWQNATLENILINQKLLSMYDSIILILRLHNPGSKSVCEMLTDLKGSAVESKRKPYQIRYQIKPINYMLNYVHSSDNVNDFIRELGILLNFDEIIQTFNAIISNRIISYPCIEIFHFPKQNYTLDKWMNNICNQLKTVDICISDQKYILSQIQLFKKFNTDFKISFNFLSVLCQYNLIKWNFNNIVFLSNNINYTE